ncbi:MAG: anti-sigma factor [Azospirillum sp.]|nr:anti-sigma factor [Azospirillum sp.]
MTSGLVRESDLHAYVDGQLDPGRRLEVEAWLASDGEVAARVDDYRTQTEALHALFDGVLAEPVPETLALSATALADRLTSRLPANQNRWSRLRRPLVRAAVAALLLTVGVGTGYFGHEEVAPLLPAPVGHPALLTFAQEAAQAHDFYAHSRFEVEMGADDRDALDGWLSERLGNKVFAPDLTAAGFQLLGGRSLPVETGVGAQYMYQTGDGKRLTLFVGALKSTRNAGVTFRQQGNFGMIFWVEGLLSYALVGQMERDQLMAIAGKAFDSLRLGPVRPLPPAAVPMPAETREPPATPPAGEPRVQPISAEGPTKPS